MPVPAYDPAIAGVKCTVSGPVRLPNGVAPLEGTWRARIRTNVSAAIDADGTIRAGEQSVYDDGAGASMILPPGVYEFTFTSSALGAGGRQVVLGPYAYELGEDDVTWGDIMTTPYVVPVTPADVTLAEQARQAAQAAALAAEDAQEAAEAVGITSAAQVKNAIDTDAGTQASLSAATAAELVRQDADPATNFREQQDARLRAAFVGKDQIYDWSVSSNFVPSVSGLYLITLLGAGGGGGGGSTAASTATLQPGGTGGAAGMFSQQIVPLVAGTTYSVTVGIASGTRGLGGAAGGSNGTNGSPGQGSTFGGPGLPVLYADGGGGGQRSSASSTSTPSTAVWGAGQVGHTTSVTAPGNGGIVNTSQGFGTVPTPFGVGGAGGAPATAGGQGGVGGATASAWAHGVNGSSANTGSAAGGNGADAVLPGCGGGGGGGANQGAGGNGGLGGNGYVSAQLVG